MKLQYTYVGTLHLQSNEIHINNHTVFFMYCLWSLPRVALAPHVAVQFPRMVTEFPTNGYGIPHAWPWHPYTERCGNAILV